MIDALKIFLRDQKRFSVFVVTAMGLGARKDNCEMTHVFKSALNATIALLLTGIVGAQNGDLPPGKYLIIDGIPRIPRSLARAVANYRDSVGDLLLGWDPVKPAMVIIRKRPNEWQVGTLASAAGQPVRLASVPGGCYGTYYQPKGKSLVFNVDNSSGKEFLQLYYYDIATGAQSLITDGKSRNLYPLWSNSGDWLLYSSSRRNGKDLDIYAIRPDDRKSDHMVAQVNGNDWASFDWSPDDRSVIISDYRSTNESYLWILDIVTGERRLLTPSKKAEKIFNGSYAQFSKDGKGVYHITDRDSEFQRLAYLDISSGRYTYVTSQIKWDVEEFALSPDRTLLAFVTNEEGISNLHLLDTKAARELRVGNLPIGTVSGLRWDSSGNNLGLVISSKTSPGDIFSLSARTGEIEQWTRTQAFGPQLPNLPDPEVIRWKSFDGRLIPGLFYRPGPKFVGRRPVLIDIHGGFNGQSRPDFKSKDPYLTAEMGIAIIYPNVRGSGGYGKRYLELDNGYLREDSYKDIATLLDWIKARPDLDADNVIVRGASAGGNIALAVATMCGSRIRGVIARAGPSNLATFLDTVDAWYRDSFRAEYGDERDSTMRRFLERIAPAQNVKQIRTPLLIIHGKMDGRVPVSESEQMITAAKREGIQVWSLLITNEGHAFADPTTRDFAFLAEVAFVQRCLSDSRAQ